ncbi:MAG: DUF2330 domain-containing protein, partial [Candidatus Limnocylindrales bacterium]
CRDSTGTSTRAPASGDPTLATLMGPAAQPGGPPMRRLFTILGATFMALSLSAGPTLACGGLIGPNGAVNLLRTTTFAGYHEGVEHYVTSFEFAGGGGAFGSLIPLPGIPSDVVKGGDWTLQRLVKETTPPAPAPAFLFGSAAASADSAQVIMERKIDALDITVLKGGANEVGTWAKQHGFRLPPDAPQVLDFYAKRSPIFLAAAFDPTRAAARDQQVGDGTPVHITIPTPNPWVPLRILALGKTDADRVDADVFLLTDRQPTLLPAATTPGLSLAYDAQASTSLLDDLRADRGMEWVPDTAWLSRIAIDAKASELAFDLAIDASGQGTPSAVAAGLELPALPVAAPSFGVARLLVGIGVIGLAVLGMVWLLTRQPAGRTLSR